MTYTLKELSIYRNSRNFVGRPDTEVLKIVLGKHMEASLKYDTVYLPGWLVM